MSTLADLRTNVAAEVGLDNSTGGDQGLIDKWANAAVLDILQKTHCHVRRSTAAMTSGTYDYEFPTSILAVINMTSNLTVNGRMTRLTVPEIEELRGASGQLAPARYYAVLGDDFYTVYPTPSTGEVVTFIYVPKPTVMSSGTHDPSDNTYGGIPAWAHDTIELYMLYRAARYDNHGPSKNGDAYNLAYKESLAWVKKMARDQGGSLLPVARLGRSRGLVPHDPSTDL
jgi:hypothetical protein